MLDIRFIKENKNLVKQAVHNKQLDGTVDIDKLVDIYDKYLDLLRRVESHRSLKNTLSKDIATLQNEQKIKVLDEAKKLKEELSVLEEELSKLKTEMDAMLLWVPNPPAADVPIGKDETENVEVRKVGKPKEFSFTPKDHMELGELLGILDTKRGAKIGGFRSYFVLGAGMQLEQAILRYALDFMIKQGFTPMSVPVMVNKDYFVGTGYFPWGTEDHYSTQDGQALIGTAEVSLTSYYADEILKESELPVKLVGMSSCYRREIGSYGKDTKGVFRVHYFNKVEQVVLVPEGEDISREWHEKMLGYVETILQNLELPYRVLLMCTGDMGPGQRKKYDVETWFPSHGAYKETHSDSYFLDFQARRLNMRYADKKGNLKFVSTLNNTVVATPRLLAAVLENYQQKDGSVLIPEVLKSYMGIEVIEPRNS